MDKSEKDAKKLANKKSRELYGEVVPYVNDLFEGNLTTALIKELSYEF